MPRNCVPANNVRSLAKSGEMAITATLRRSRPLVVCSQRSPLFVDLKTPLRTVLRNAVSSLGNLGERTMSVTTPSMSPSLLRDHVSPWSKDRKTPPGSVPT